MAAAVQVVVPVFLIVTVAVNVAPARTDVGTDWLTKVAPLPGGGGVGVHVGVRVGVAVRVGVRVAVAVRVGAVTVAVGVLVAVLVGVWVGVFVGVGAAPVGVRVAVGGTGVDVAVGGTTVGVRVAVGGTGVSVGVAVGGTGLGVGDGTAPGKKRMSAKKLFVLVEPPPGNWPATPIAPQYVCRGPFVMGMPKLQPPKRSSGVSLAQRLTV